MDKRWRHTRTLSTVATLDGGAGEGEEEAEAEEARECFTTADTMIKRKTPMRWAMYGESEWYLWRELSYLKERREAGRKFAWQRGGGGRWGTERGGGERGRGESGRSYQTFIAAEKRTKGIKRATNKMKSVEVDSKKPAEIVARTAEEIPK
jgi:hypothetical protein